VGSAGNIVHLRLILSGSELSCIPFELAVAPQGYPGEGVEFCLQASLPIVVTREVHRDRPRSSGWANQGLPKILFVWAEPEGLKVPAKAHVEELRKTVEPWTRRVSPEDGAAGGETAEQKRLGFVKERLRLLPNASVEQIYQLCAKERFTHVHILAHGDVYNEGGVDRFGVALCRDGDPQRKEVVSGKRLAKALLAEDFKGAGRAQPLVVTLATCDAGNQNQVLVPGGSIAHELHGEGIPWVFASQFPLTKAGSVRMTRIIYERLLRGDDPRQMLFELRRELYRSARGDHDWASIVAYSSVSANFAEEVAEYCWLQIRRAINVCLDYADGLTVDQVKVEAAAGAPATGSAASQPAGGSAPRPGAKEEADATAKEVGALLAMARARMPKGNSAEARLRRAEIIGMQGSTLKRIALLLQKIHDDSSSNSRYKEALTFYRQAMDEAASLSEKYYWNSTQYLSLCAVRCGPKEPDIYELSRQLAKRDVELGQDKSAKAWAHATVAELELLGAYHLGRMSERAVDEVRDRCRQIIELTGRGSFEIWSTPAAVQAVPDYWDDDKDPSRRGR
jgi:hypothetical protein